MEKQAMCNALRRFINQRSGIDVRNYDCGDWKRTREAFNGDYRPMQRYGKHARMMLTVVESDPEITAEMLLDAAKRSFSGRLTFVERDDKVGVDYCTGQYFPTEYRNAACAVLACALRSRWEKLMPEAVIEKRSTGALYCPIEVRIYDGLTWLKWMQRRARDLFGRAVAATWFA